MFRVSNITFVLLLSLLLIPIKSFPQKDKFRFEHLTTGNGLFQNVVYSVLQDSRGYLWVGTQDGLNRYDGYNFKVYKYESGNPNSISHNEVETLYIDKDDILWIGTLGGGLNKYNSETENFISYKADKNNQFSISSNLVMAIYEDEEGTLWIGTDGDGLNRFDRNSGQFTSYKHSPMDSSSLSNDKVFAICEDQFGNFWIGTFGGGLNKFDRTTGKFVHYKHDPNNKSSLSSDKIHRIYEDNEGIIWIGTYLGGLNKLVAFSEKDGSPEFVHFISHNFLAPNSLGNNTIWAILEDSNGIFWVGTQWGLNICDKTNIIKLFRDDPRDPENINYSSIYSLYEDESSILWIGTTGGGLNKLNKNKMDFTSYNHKPFDKKGLNGRPINCFYEENDSTIWVGTGSGGINVMNRNSEEFTGYKYDPTQPRGLVTNIVQRIIKDRNGIIWVGTGIGLFKLLTKIDEAGGPIFEKYFNDPEDPSSLSNNSINSILEDKFGALWFGTSEGISILTPEEQKKSDPKFLIYRNNPDDIKSLSDNYTNQIFEDKSGEIWIATNRVGICKYRRDTDSFIRYRHDPNNAKSISSDLILCIYQDNAGQMWFGTGDGICNLNRVTQEFNRYSQNNGLIGEYVFGILEDDTGSLWLSTNKGISRFNPRNLSFKNFDENDGLQEGGYYRRAYLKTKSGEFLFGGLKGFNLFHPDSIKENTHIPPIVITDFQLNNLSIPVGLDTSANRTILKKSISETKEIELNYNDKTISFEFSALDFYIPEKNQYSYMLEGFEDNWNYTDASRRYVTYTNLDPGDYNFRVKGSNNDGYWNEEGASIKIIILPPWWSRTWAYIIYSIFILS
ncbi:MAG: triple tyrosine motif-containing protein, partial [Ignavibacteriaceae bacterium]|nr:triple tyrosine motif-containing protein [Ignavibacteriaceae bacterium]